MKLAETEFTNHLQQSLEALSGLAQQTGVYVRPYQSKEQITKCPPSLRQEILAQIDQYLKVIDQSELTPQKGKQSEICIFRAALRKNSYSPYDKVESYFDEGDIIEIYDLSGIQKYRNLVFLNYCSFDLFTLYSHPFFQLYERSKEFDKQVLSCIEEVVQSPKGTISFRCEPHLLKEKYLKNKKIFKVHPKWISPLKGPSGSVEAVVLTNCCKEYTLKPVDSSLSQ